MTWSATFEMMAAVTLITVAGYLYLGWQAAAFDRRFGSKDRLPHGPGRKLP